MRGSGEEEAVHCPQLRIRGNLLKSKGWKDGKMSCIQPHHVAIEVGRKRSTQMAAHLAKPACLQGVGKMQSLTPSHYKGGKGPASMCWRGESGKKSLIGIADLIWELDQIQSDTGPPSSQAEQ